MWGIKDDELSGRWDWEGLRKQIKKHVRVPLEASDILRLAFFTLSASMPL